MEIIKSGVGVLLSHVHFSVLLPMKKLSSTSLVPVQLVICLKLTHTLIHQIQHQVLLMDRCLGSNKSTSFKNPNPQGILTRNRPKSSKIHNHAVKRYPNCWTLMELVQQQMQSIHGLAIHSPESNKSSRWSLMDLVHMATCSIRWATLWSAESIKIRQNQEKDFGGFGVVKVKSQTESHTLRMCVISL